MIKIINNPILLKIINKVSDQNNQGFKSGLRSPDILDEAVIKQATQLSVSETIKLHSFRTCEWEYLSLLVSPSFNLTVAEPLTNSLTYTKQISG